jgi:hypothetical protein
VDERSDVAELAARLHEQEGVVEAGELLHRDSSRAPAPSMRRLLR